MIITIQNNNFKNYTKMTTLKYNLLGATYFIVALILLILGAAILIASFFGVFTEMDLHNFIPHPTTRFMIFTLIGLAIMFGGASVFGELDKLSLKYYNNEK